YPAARALVAFRVWSQGVGKGGIRNDGAVAAGELRFIKRRVHPPEGRHEILIRQDSAHPETGRDRHGFFFFKQGLADDPADLLCQIKSIIDAGIRADQQKFFSAPAAEDILAADITAHEQGKLLEDLVTHRMAAPIVDTLEMVDVHQYQRYRPLAWLCQQLSDALVDGITVIDAGQRIQMRKGLQP